MAPSSLSPPCTFCGPTSVALLKPPSVKLANSAEDVSSKQSVECACGRSREASPVVMIDTRRAAIDDDWKLAGAQLESKAPCMRGGADCRGRRPAPISAISLVRRVRCAHSRNSAPRGVACPRYRHRRARWRGNRWRGAATVEARETAVAEAEETDIGMERSIASVSCLGGNRSRATKHCRSGRRSSRRSTSAVGLREI